MGAEFKVIKEDPGTGWHGLLLVGRVVTNAQRCCQRCALIFGDIEGCTGIEGFLLDELTPLNDQAHAVVKEIEEFLSKFSRRG